MAHAATASPLPPNVPVFASRLNNPRGLKFSPAATLYVTEGGLGGSHTTTPAECAQVAAPVGPTAVASPAAFRTPGPGGQDVDRRLDHHPAPHLRTAPPAVCLRGNDRPRTPRSCPTRHGQVVEIDPSGTQTVVAQH